MQELTKTTIIDDKPKAEPSDKDMKSQILTDSRIEGIYPLSSPREVMDEIPQSEESARTVVESRRAIEEIISPWSKSKRLLAVVGPCSIHDQKAALEYAQWLKDQRDKYSDRLEIIMRTYLEKPRTTLGWKGIINDPNLDGTFDINKGMRVGRQLLHEITRTGLPVSYELLSARTPQYIADLVSWGAIGARTTESQLHRELVSGVSFPVGYKNGTSGNLQIVIDAIIASRAKHIFMGIDLDGKTAVVKTTGNPYCHAVLRGGSEGPNYDKESIAEAVGKLEKAGLNTSVMIDCSHGNSSKDYRRQEDVLSDVAGQIANGNENICGVMIESNLVEGAQKLVDKDNLVYGQSITDGCVGLDTTARMLQKLADAAESRF
ncbi:MAG TPA: 3-deoxy-7-phosphoheptulonate synthase [Candidatus Saccharimonadales bacterium]|nr:3-deoxy-7-phosphoheptulonate synthase [Candidatus Saccharimonadales bacterium]